MALLEMKHVTKRFGSVVANDDVSFSVERGEVHALLGENGAGKSTLMNILYGMYSQSEGEIFFNDEKIRISNPQKAIEAGIGMVHQHFMLINALTVIENVVLGYKGNKPVLDLKAAAEEFSKLAARYEMEIDPWEMIENLSVGQQQRVEILKALYRDAELLILDEPTAVLTPNEVENLHKMMVKLTSENKSVIFISHKMLEIMDMCDRCTVLRQGKVVAEGLPISEIESIDLLAELMVGKGVELVAEKPLATPGEPILSVKNLSYTDPQGIQRLKNISFDVRAGEIVGICGVDGNGQSELIRCITGLISKKEGTITICGADCSHASAREILNHSVAHIPEDRHKMGMIGKMTLTENSTLTHFCMPFFSKNGFMKWKRVDNYCSNICEKYNVKTPGTKETIEHLSGGNQQKLVVGRELSENPKLIIAVHPCRGLDVGATNFIQRCLIEARDKGAAVLMVSTELYEVMDMSDQIMPMFEGQIMGIIPQQEATREELGKLMSGVKDEKLQPA